MMEREIQGGEKSPDTERNPRKSLCFRFAFKINTSKDDSSGANEKTHMTHAGADAVL